MAIAKNYFGELRSKLGFIISVTLSLTQKYGVDGLGVEHYHGAAKDGDQRVEHERRREDRCRPVHFVFERWCFFEVVREELIL